MKNPAAAHLNLLSIANCKAAILLILSFFTDRELIVLSRVNKRLNHVAHYSVYNKIYCRIEADLNYRPKLSLQALFDLVMTREGISKYDPIAQATMIKPIKYDKGRLYNIVSIHYGNPFDDDSLPVKLWYASHTKVLVQPSGVVSFYDEFGDPIKTSGNICLKDFLNRPCLHSQKEDTIAINS